MTIKLRFVLNLWKSKIKICPQSVEVNMCEKTGKWSSTLNHVSCRTVNTLGAGGFFMRFVGSANVSAQYYYYYAFRCLCQEGNLNWPLGR
jgi:hypothetical protein